MLSWSNVITNIYFDIAKEILEYPSRGSDNKKHRLRNRSIRIYEIKKGQGRNDSCNCDSGKKYKNCCGKEV